MLIENVLLEKKNKVLKPILYVF